MLQRFGKNPKIEFFTKIETLPEVVPVQHGARMLPAWWKKPPCNSFQLVTTHPFSAYS
jgi:hypothetical protein